MLNLFVPANTAKTIISEKWMSISIILFAFLLYANTLNHGFVLDDIAVIEQNKFVQQGIYGIPDLFTSFYWKGFTNANVGLYRPLSLIAFAIEHQISPENPKIHHFFNLLYYALSVWLLFKTFIILFPKINRLFLFGGVLIFIAHPTHTEVVANIKSRDEIFSLLFFLLSLSVLYHPKLKNQISSKIAAPLLFFLALLSKENTLFFLPIFIIYEYIQNPSIIHLLKRVSGFMIISIFWLILRHWAIHQENEILDYTFNDNSILAAKNWMVQKATAFSIFFHYCIKVFYPYELAYDYSFSQIPLVTFLSFKAILGILFFLLSIYLMYRYYKTTPLVCIALAFMFFPLLLSSHLLFPIGTTFADRFLFSPSVGSALLLAAIIAQVSNSNNALNQKLFLVITSFIVVHFSIQTQSRNLDWKDNYSLFTKDVVIVPNSARAQYNAGIAYMELSNEKVEQVNNNLEKAKKAFENCLSLDSTYTNSYINLAVLYQKQNNYSTALQLYKKAFILEPNKADLHSNMGEVFFHLKQMDSAISHLNRAQKLGNASKAIPEFLGLAYFERRQYQQAITSFEKGIALNSDNANLYLNLGNAYVMNNQNEKGIEAMQRSIATNPNNKQAYYFLALTYNKIKDSLNAQKYLEIYNTTK